MSYSNAVDWLGRVQSAHDEGAASAQARATKQDALQADLAAQIARGGDEALKAHKRLEQRLQALEDDARAFEASRASTLSDLHLFREQFQGGTDAMRAALRESHDEAERGRKGLHDGLEGALANLSRVRAKADALQMAHNELKLEVRTMRRALDGDRLDASQRYDHLNRIMHATSAAALEQAGAEGGGGGSGPTPLPGGVVPVHERLASGGSAAAPPPPPPGAGGAARSLRSSHLQMGLEVIGSRSVEHANEIERLASSPLRVAQATHAIDTPPPRRHTPSPPTSDTFARQLSADAAATFDAAAIRARVPLPTPSSAGDGGKRRRDRELFEAPPSPERGAPPDSSEGRGGATEPVAASEPQPSERHMREALDAFTLMSSSAAASVAAGVPTAAEVLKDALGLAISGAPGGDTLAAGLVARGDGIAIAPTSKISAQLFGGEAMSEARVKHYFDTSPAMPLPPADADADLPPAMSKEKMENLSAQLFAVLEPEMKEGFGEHLNVSALEISGPRFNRPFGESDEYPGFTREPPLPPLEPPVESEPP